MIQKLFHLIFVVLILLGTEGLPTMAADTPPATTITLEQAVYFLAPTGDSLLVKAGTYDVEAAEDWLRLIPQGHSRVESLLLDADVSELDGLLNIPHAASQQTGKDQHLLTLLLPNGTQLESEGSYSGIRSRGRLSLNRLLKRKSALQRRKTLTPLIKSPTLKPVPQRPKIINRLPLKGKAPQIRTVRGPDKKLVEQLLARLNCANPKVTGLSPSHCQRVKANLRKRLQGYRVVGKGQPKQHVNLYVAKGCPAKEDFRRRVAQEVVSSLPSRLRSTSTKVAARISSLFNGYWKRLSNVLIGKRGTFQSVLIVPTNTRIVTVSTLTKGPCSKAATLPQPATSGGTPPPPPPPPPPSSTPVSVSPSDYLAAHNAVRANVSPPATPPLTPFTWNQEMANVAQNWANQCILGHNAERGPVGENLYVTSASPTALAEQAVQAWASEAPNYDLATNTCTNGTCGHYTQLVWNSTTQLGCGAASCPGIENFSGQTGTITVCNYHQRGNFNNLRPYESPLVTQPPEETTEAGTTPLPEPATYPNLQSAFLGYHNAVRSSVIPSPTTPLPSLTWNQEMANIAQGWANQCVLGYNAERGPVGENLYVTSATPNDLPHLAVQAWTAEAPHYNLATNTCVAGEICGHYTQLVWEQTTELGCAIASCPAIENFAGTSGTIAVCNYSPQGNFNNQRPYDLD